MLGIPYDPVTRSYNDLCLIFKCKYYRNVSFFQVKEGEVRSLINETSYWNSVNGMASINILKTKE